MQLIVAVVVDVGRHFVGCLFAKGISVLGFECMPCVNVCVCRCLYLCVYVLDCVYRAGSQWVLESGHNFYGTRPLELPPTPGFDVSASRDFYACWLLTQICAIVCVCTLNCVCVNKTFLIKLLQCGLAGDNLAAKIKLQVFYLSGVAKIWGQAWKSHAWAFTHTHRERHIPSICCSLATCLLQHTFELLPKCNAAIACENNKRKLGKLLSHVQLCGQIIPCSSVGSCVFAC